MSQTHTHRAPFIGSDFVTSVVIFVLVFATLSVLVKNGALPAHFFTFH